MNDFQAKYLAEVSHRLQREGFSVETENEGLLPVEKNSHRLCNINMYGGMSYDSDFVQRNGLDDALDQVRDIVVETLAYMRQMMTAPPLLAEGLSGDYRLLAEFNHIVLAGHEREGNYGVEFVTWERIRNGTSLWQGQLRQQLCCRKAGFCHPLRTDPLQPPFHTGAACGNLRRSAEHDYSGPRFQSGAGKTSGRDHETNRRSGAAGDRSGK